MIHNFILTKQECIPVGCVPSAAMAVFGGVSLPRGVSARGGVCSRGGCLLLGVVSAPGRIWSGGSAPRGVSALGGCGIPACTEADTPRVHRHTPVKT